MFDRFFKKRDNKNADRQKRGTDMSDGVTWDNHEKHIHMGMDHEERIVMNEDGTVTAHNLDVSGILADAIVEERASHEESVAADKPDFGDAGMLVRKFSGFRGKQTSTGPQVDYVNRVLGVEADEFSRETAAAVKRYQHENGLKPTGRVDAELYDKL